jgi:hypothetical protein
MIALKFLTGKYGYAAAGQTPVSEYNPTMYSRVSGGRLMCAGEDILQIWLDMRRTFTIFS